MGVRTLVRTVGVDRREKPEREAPVCPVSHPGSTMVGTVDPQFPIRSGSSV